MQEDYTQARNLVEERPEVVERLKKAMAGEIRRQQAPLDHLERLDLKDL